MNLALALDILEINDYSNINIINLKKIYYKLALENHPDKNGNTTESNEKFQQINEAYNYLKREISVEDNNDMSHVSQNNDYSVFLNLFISTILQGDYTEIFSSILKDIISGCTRISLKLFEKIDKENSINIYIFLSKYKNLFRIDNGILEDVKKIILDKCKDDEVYILNPTLDDLFENNIYKLCLDGKIYFVPLWHNECYFDGIKGDIIVKCVPYLPDNIILDEDNNLIINLEIPFDISLLDNNEIPILLGKKTITIIKGQLLMKRNQTVVFKNKGISKIMEDINDINIKSDIIVKIKFI
jgi:DnaJ-class molecular chaperone